MLHRIRRFIFVNNKIYCSRKIELFFLLSVVIIASFLMFYNLGNQYLWGDEAQTALVGKTILTHGIPKGYDGHNYFSAELGAEYGNNYTWRLHPWVPFYLVAASFKIFGVNTYAARLPFAFFGLLTILLAYFLSKSLFKEKRTAFIAVLLFLTSIPFLLLTKFCRYPSPAMFLSLLGLYSYLRIIEKKKYGFLMLIFSSFLLFNTFQMYVVTLFISIIIHAFIYHKSELKKIILSFVIVLAINIQNIIWIFIMNSRMRRGGNLFDFLRFAGFGRYYLYMIFRFVFPWFVLFALPLILLFRRYNVWRKIKINTLQKERIMLLLLYVFVNIAVLAFVADAPFFRYLSAAVPAILIITAFIISIVSRYSVVIGVGLLMLVLSFGSFKSYLYEITHNYDGPMKGISTYLNKHGTDKDTVLITDGDLPLKFYTKMKIYGGRASLKVPDEEPNWLIIRNFFLNKGLNSYYMKYISEKVNMKNYNMIVIDYPDIPFENRESPMFHHFKTVQNAARVVLLKRK